MQRILASMCLGLIVASTHAAAPPVRPRSHAEALPAGAIARLGTMRYRFDGVPTEIALSRDGKLAALNLNVCNRGITLVLDTATGQRHSLVADLFVSTWFDISRDGKHLLCGGHDGARFYDIRQGTVDRQVKLEFRQAHRFAISGNEQILAASSYANPRAGLVTYDLKADTVLAKMEAIHGSEIGLVLSHDGKWLVNHGSGERGKGERLAQTVQLWDTATGKEVRRIEIERDESITDVAFSPDDRTLAIATFEGLVQLVDRATGRMLRTWRGPGTSWGLGLSYLYSVRTVLTFSPDSKHLILGERNSPFAPAVWEVATGRRVALAPMPGRFLNVGFDKGRIVALGMQRQTLFAWDLLTGKHLHGGDTLPTGPIGAVGWQGERIVTYADQRGSIWDTDGKRLELLPVARERRDFPSFTNRTDTTVLSPDAKYVATTAPAPEGAASVRDLLSAESVISLSRPDDDLIIPSFSHDGRSVALSLYDSRTQTNRVHVLRPDSGEERLAYSGGKMVPTGAAIDPAGKRLAVALAPRERNGEPGTLVTWRIDTNKEDPSFTKVDLPALPARKSRFERQVSSPLVYSPDGSLLARVVLGDFGQSVQLYDAVTGEERLHLGVGGKALVAPVFSPDSRTLAVVSGSRTLEHSVTLWELRTGKMRWTRQLPATPSALAFSPTGRLLVTGHHNATALVWDVSGQHATGNARADYDSLWRELVNGGSMTAFEAQRRLAANGNRAVDALAARLKPAEGKSLDPATLTKLIEQLDDDDPAVRQQAMRTLEPQTRVAEPILRKTLEDKPSAEVTRSVRSLLARLHRPMEAGEERGSLRAVEVLEWIGTQEARRVVEKLASGWEGASLTREAKATLARWK